MSRNKRLVRLMLTLMLVLSMVPALIGLAVDRYGFAMPGWERTTIHVNGDVTAVYTYTLDENEKATITGYRGDAVTVTIPRQLDGYDVVAIGSKAFLDNKSFEVLILQDNITSIGHSAFRNCQALHRVQFAEGLTLIDENAFRDCISLTEVILPASLTQINGGAFASCTALQKLEFNEGLKAIYYGAFSGTNGAFQDCTSLTDVRLPDSLEILGCGTFRSCTALAKVYIPANTDLQEYTSENHMYPGPFSGCSSLNEVVFGEGIERIPFGLFYGCTGLKEIVIPDTVSRIRYNAFLYCENLERVTLPQNLVAIEGGAFRKCISLKEITLPETLEHLGNGAFLDCTALTSVNIPKLTATEAYTGENGQHPGPFSGCSNLTDVEFEDGITRIPKGMFWGCTGLKELILPETVTEVGFRAFQGCSNLERVLFHDHLTTIRQEAFVNCTALTEVVLPAELQELNIGTFAGCTALTKVVLPRNFSVNTDYSDFFHSNSGVFGSCSSLTEVVFHEKTTNIPRYLFWNCSGLTEIAIPEGVTTIERSAFNNCTNLATVDLPDSLLKIGVRAFAHCAALGPVEFGDNLQTIDCEAFRNCPSITDLQLPDSLVELGYGAFWDCHGLTSVAIPKDVDVGIFSSDFSSYGEGPFHWAQNLKEVTLAEGTTNIDTSLLRGCIALEQIHIPETVTRIGDSAFYQCQSLREVTIPEQVTQIGWDLFKDCTALEEVVVESTSVELEYYTFENCTALRQVVLPDGMTMLGKSVFLNCSSLMDLRLPASLTEIGESCFQNCDSLTEITIPDQVKKIGGNAFYDCDSLQSVVMGDFVTSLGSGAFQHCDVLKDVKLSNGLTAINWGTFRECAAMEEIQIPRNVTKIDSYAFHSNTALTKVVLPRGISKIASNAFSYPGTTVLHGVAGTYAETWAAENGYQFVPYSIAAEVVSVPAELKLCLWETYQIPLMIQPADSTDEISWKSSDPAVVTVSDTGKVQAVGLGTAVIKVTVGDHSVSCKITVVQGVEWVGISYYSLTLQVQETFQLTAAAYPEHAENRNVLWESEDPTIATVTDAGLVTAVGPGEVKITAYAETDPEIRASCTVIVKNDGIFVTDPEALESQHNYPNSSENFWVYIQEGAEKLAVTFDARTVLEDGFDFLVIFGRSGEEYVQVGKYTGTELAGVTVEVPGDTLKIQLLSDASGNDWGFKVTAVEPVYPHVHEYTESVTEPGCTEGGYTTYTCACGDTYTGNETAALGHTYEETVTVPTCTEAGYTTHTCTACGNSYTDEEVAALGHEYVNGICIRCSEQDGTYVPVNPFGDVKETDYFFQPVLWAVDNGITSGTGAGKFSPEDTCTRAQVVTFLWRAMGKPAPVSRENHFTDVPADAYYYDAVLWAVENGITSGTGNGKFSPDDSCTRAQVVTFLWRAMGKTAPESDENPFGDVNASDYFYNPVLWAVENKITAGTGAGKFSPEIGCTRGQVVTFLYRAMEN